MTKDFERLQLVMSINNSFQSNIRHADAKIGMLAVACSAMVTATLTQASTVRHAVQRPSHVLVVALAAWVLVLGLAATQMIRAVRPRLDPPGSRNHFALISWNVPGIRHVRTDVLCEEASTLGRTLAGIAARKYRAVTAALYATAGLAVLTAVCFALTALAS